MDIDKLLRIRHYMMNEDYKKDVISYMLEVATQNVCRQGNFQDGMLYMIDQIRKVPEKVNRSK